MRILICKCPSAQGHDENTTTDFTARCDKVTAMVLDVSAVTKPQPDGANSTWIPSQVYLFIALFQHVMLHFINIIRRRSS